MTLHELKTPLETLENTLEGINDRLDHFYSALTEVPEQEKEDRIMEKIDHLDKMKIFYIDAIKMLKYKK